MELDLWALPRDEEGIPVAQEDGPNGGTPMQTVSYEEETGTLTLCQTFYSREALSSLTLSVRKIMPGARSFQLALKGSQLDALVPEGEEPGVAVTSMGFAEDGRPPPGPPPGKRGVSPEGDMALPSEPVGALPDCERRLLPALGPTGHHAAGRKPGGAGRRTPARGRRHGGGDAGGVGLGV